MATIATPPQKRTSRLGWRATRGALLAVLSLLIAVVLFALVQPLAMLRAVIQTRLFFDGRASVSTTTRADRDRLWCWSMALEDAPKTGLV
jgi:membrane glycosyltransferase